jgi:hypothetical protein
MCFPAEDDSRETVMISDELFGALPEQREPSRVVGEARLIEPQRDQIELRAMDIDSLIGQDHPARLVWDHVGELEDAIKAREGVPGHPAITPRLLLALWLYGVAGCRSTTTR